MAIPPTRPGDPRALQPKDSGSNLRILLEGDGEPALPNTETWASLCRAWNRNAVPRSLIGDFLAISIHSFTLSSSCNTFVHFHIRWKVFRGQQQPCGVLIQGRCTPRDSESLRARSPLGGAWWHATLPFVITQNQSRTTIVEGFPTKKPARSHEPECGQESGLLSHRASRL